MTTLPPFKLGVCGKLLRMQRLVPRGDEQNSSMPLHGETGMNNTAEGGKSWRRAQVGERGCEYACDDPVVMGKLLASQRNVNSRNPSQKSFINGGFLRFSA